MAADPPSPEPPQPTPTADASTVPRWRFHLVVTLLTGCLLWAVSVPGAVLPAGYFVLLGLCAAAVIWAARLVIALRNRTPSWSFAVAPIGALIVLVLVVMTVPLQMRWGLSKPAFDAVVEDAALATSEQVDIRKASWIGLYHISRVTRVPGGFVFYEANGSLFDHAGFAYLPDGPTPRLENGSFESPTFRHLGGPWYTFTASW
ncbi:hypothetical protein [Actinopolymorpha singaporensis]|uniref:hypothetical protein n=1 Tax=Actinopolymorpha singaporensis TaxID=117157 RepID=UPI0012FD7118|nr:hypothetical protein [Actinopolymorpha singaporensis]